MQAAAEFAGGAGGKGARADEHAARPQAHSPMTTARKPHRPKIISPKDTLPTIYSAEVENII